MSAVRNWLEEIGLAQYADAFEGRIGVPDYAMTAALWFRATLKDLYGIEAKDNVWFNGRTKELSHGGALGLDRAALVGVTHHWLSVDQTLDMMLDRGELDACTAIRPSSRREHPWVALELFDAFCRSKEVAYQRARRYASAYLYFSGADRQEQAAVLGEDPYPLGLRAMGKNVERAIRGSLEQGL
jgi:hypothetical protein